MSFPTQDDEVADDEHHRYHLQTNVLPDYIRDNNLTNIHDMYIRFVLGNATDTYYYNARSSSDDDDDDSDGGDEYSLGSDFAKEVIKKEALISLVNEFAGTHDGIVQCYEQFFDDPPIQFPMPEFTDVLVKHGYALTDFGLTTTVDNKLKDAFWDALPYRYKESNG